MIGPVQSHCHEGSPVVCKRAKSENVLSVGIWAPLKRTGDEVETGRGKSWIRPTLATPIACVSAAASLCRVIGQYCRRLRPAWHMKPTEKSAARRLVSWPLWRQCLNQQLTFVTARRICRTAHDRRRLLPEIYGYFCRVVEPAATLIVKLYNSEYWRAYLINSCSLLFGGRQIFIGWTKAWSIGRRTCACYEQTEN